MDPQMADKVVDAGDGRIVSFPGSMGDEDIAKALRPAPDYSDNLARSAKPTKFEQENSSVPRNFVRGVGESVHKIGQNLEHMNPIEAGMSMVGGGGMPDIQPPAPGKEFKWSDAKPSIRNVGRSLVDDIAPGKDLSEKGANAATLPLTALMADRDVPIQGEFPHYNPPEQVPFSMSRATGRSAAGAAVDLLSPHPSPSRAAMTAGVGLASEVLPWAATKVARSKPVVDFLTRKGGPRSTAPAREPLWKQAGIEAEGHGEPNVQVTHPPEPAARPHRESSAAPQLESAGDTATRLAGQPKNLATDMTEAEATEVSHKPPDPALVNVLNKNGFKFDHSEKPVGADFTWDWYKHPDGRLITIDGSHSSHWGITDKPTAEGFEYEGVGAKDAEKYLGKPTPPDLPKLKGGNLPIPDVHKDAFQRFVKSNGKEGPLARQTKKPAPEPAKPPSTSRRPDMQDDQAVRQEIEQRTQVRPKEPGRKGKAELAADMKAEDKSPLPGETTDMFNAMLSHERMLNKDMESRIKTYKIKRPKFDGGKK